MPNNQWPDYVPVHQHALDDFQGTLPIPPVVYVSSNTLQTTNSVVYAPIDNMDVDVELSTEFPMWEIYVEFTGQFAHTVQYSEVGFQIVQDDTDALVQRSLAVPQADEFASVKLFTTVVVAGGTTVNFKAYWNTTAATAAFPEDAGDRNLTATPRPYCPQAI